MWSKRTFLTVLGSLPFVSILKPVKADDGIIRFSYRGVKCSYTEECAKDMIAVYHLEAKSEFKDAIDMLKKFEGYGASIHG
jgi:hypothetical protein